ncbi:MAG: serine/threonine protein kinase [Proteobacteria bacterium]|nr:serine/threonine protein kinase [Pseudomonadota bacterium]
MAPTQRLDGNSEGDDGRDDDGDDGVSADERTARRLVDSSERALAAADPTRLAYRRRPGSGAAAAAALRRPTSSARPRTGRAGSSAGSSMGSSAGSSMGPSAANRSAGGVRSAPPAGGNGVTDANLGRVLGSYRLVGVLGRGGMGTVYRAEHVMLGRKVALKLLRPEYAARREAVRRFFNEARAVNDIGHENIVDIADYQVLETGETFFIMELLEGQDLGKLVRDQGRRLELPRALEIALQVCDALEAAHAKEIIHRDLKPDNIFVTESAARGLHVTLLDFGVAKLVGLSATDSSLQTAIGSVLGTPAYMSPEQASGIAVDQRTDIYSLGAILYEMFAGRPLFRAKSFGEFVLKHLNEAPVPLRQLPDPPDVPLELERVVLRCLAKDPEQRYPSAAVLRDELLRATGAAKTARRPAVARDRSVVRHRPWKWLALGLGVTVSALAAFWLAAGLGGDDHARGALAPITAPGAGAIPGRGGNAGDKPGLATPGSATPEPGGGTAGAHSGVARLQLNTEPAGASVQRQGERRSLGTTPLTIDVPLQPEPLELVFRLPGHLEARERVGVRDGTVVWVNLEPIVGLTAADLAAAASPTGGEPTADARRPSTTPAPHPPRPPRRRPPHPIPPGETVDPFTR